MERLEREPRETVGGLILLDALASTEVIATIVSES
jgi:hypothetical protein